jgi:hypothetical protein
MKQLFASAVRLRGGGPILDTASKPWLCSGHHHLGSRSAAVAKAQRTLNLDLLLVDKMFKPPSSATRHQRGFLRS